jgi:2-oxoglutarate ferredoxin oxidoreductase subunit beta
MLFDGGARGIALDRERLCLKVVDVEGGDWEAAGVIVHDPANRGVAHMLVEMPVGEGWPVALGVLYEDPAPTFESAVVEQNAALAAGKTPDLQKLVSKGQTWEVTREPRSI